MPIEFPCTYCRENIRVPDWGEGKRTQCPVCRRVLNIPAGHSVPERSLETQIVESEIDGAPRHAEDQARRRLCIPVNACQGFLVLIVLGSLLCVALLLTSLLERAYWMPSFTVSFFWISICLVQSILGVIGIYGLQHALNLGSGHWSWTGVFISIAMGILYVVLLPFAIWSAVVLKKPEVAALLQPAKRGGEGIADAN